MSKLGFSGSIARRFQSTQITPLLALVGLLLGVFAVLVTPREEEPQINVTFANVFIPFPGASAREVESLVASPAEQVLDEIEGIKHVFSTSMPGMAVLTVQYEVGEDRTDAIVRLYSKIMSNQDWVPDGAGVGLPIVKPKGIDDVPIVTVTLWAMDPSHGTFELGQIAQSMDGAKFLKAGKAGYRWRPFAHVTANGLAGNPARSSAEKGKRRTPSSPSRSK